MIPVAKRRIETAATPPRTGFRSQGLVAGGLLFVSGMIGMRQDSAAADLTEQIDLALGHLDAVTRAAEFDRDQVVEISAFVVPPDAETAVRDRLTIFLGRSLTLVHVRQVADVAQHALVELDWVANADPARTRDQAAIMLAPFAHLPTPAPVPVGRFLLRNGLTAPGATLGEQTRNLLAQARDELRSAGSDLDQLVKLTVFIADFDHYPEFDVATREAFASFVPPACSVAVAPDLTTDALVRVDLLALASRS